MAYRGVLEYFREREILAEVDVDTRVNAHSAEVSAIGPRIYNVLHFLDGSVARPFSNLLKRYVDTPGYAEVNAGHTEHGSSETVVDVFW